MPHPEPWSSTRTRSSTPILLLVATVAVIGCAHRAPTAPRAADQLQIIADVSYVNGMGWGHIWRAKVRQVIAGTSPKDELSLSLHMNDSGGYYGGHLSDLSFEPVTLRLTFRRLEKKPSVLSGFVADDGTVWYLDEQLPSSVVQVSSDAR